MHSIIRNSFDNLKKTIIDEKIVEISGDQRRHNACDQVCNNAMISIIFQWNNLNKFNYGASS
jgi:hypothetical protein